VFVVITDSLRDSAAYTAGKNGGENTRLDVGVAIFPCHATGELMQPKYLDFFEIKYTCS